MPSYGGYGGDAGEIYAHAGQHLGEQISKAVLTHQKDKENLQAVQGLLDVAKRFQTPDPKTGKLKNWFNDQQLMDVQRLIDSGNARAAGAQEAALGIGKGMADKINGAVARQQMAAAGPITTTDASGRRYILSGNKWATDTAMPRNQMGMTPATQMRLQQAAAAQQQAQLTAARKAFQSSLKGIGVNSPVELFDTAKQEPGTISQSTDPTQDGSFLPTSQFSGPQQPGVVSQALSAVGLGGTQNADQATQPPDPTHVRIGYRPPKYNSAGTKIVDPGDPGTIISNEDLQSYQDASAQMAGPQAFQALQWLRENPDDPMAPKVEKKFKSLITQQKSPEASQYSTSVAPQAAPSAPVQVDPSADTSGDAGDDTEDQ